MGYRDFFWLLLFDSGERGERERLRSIRLYTHRENGPIYYRGPYFFILCSLNSVSVRFALRYQRQISGKKIAEIYWMFKMIVCQRIRWSLGGSRSVHFFVCFISVWIICVCVCALGFVWLYTFIIIAGDRETPTNGEYSYLIMIQVYYDLQYSFVNW